MFVHEGSDASSVEEARRLMAARDARSAARAPGRGARTPIAWRARVLGHQVGSLLIRSVARAERIHAAMLARGFDGTPRALAHLAWRRLDTCAAGLWLAGLAAALALRFV